MSKFISPTIKSVFFFYIVKLLAVIVKFCLFSLKKQEIVSWILKTLKQKIWIGSVFEFLSKIHAYKVSF